MISVLQCLMSVQQFVHYFHKKQYYDSQDIRKKSYHQLMNKFIIKMLENDKNKKEIK
jgi:hypothetical protein